MLRKMYDRTIALASKPHAMWAMGAVSFTESSFFPIPPDALLIPMVLARPDRGWTIAFVCTAASVVGGVFGYAIGYFLYETLGQWLINLYGMQQAGQEFRAAFAAYGLWVILVKGLTPIPYKLVTIVSGAAAFDIWVFIAASIVTRGVRFYAEVALLKLFGERIRKFVEKYLTWVAFGFLIFVVGGFILAAKFL
ncbi:MAG: YqaA family protein [Alphaproteobacteria bacterium]